jgi:hypothetical protein
MEKEENTINKNEKMNLQDSILSTSSNMLGFCFVVITYLEATKIAKVTLIDEFVSVSMIAFMLNCLMAFLYFTSFRWQTQRFVNINASIFVLGILNLFGIVVLLFYEIIV